VTRRFVGYKPGQAGEAHTVEAFEKLKSLVAQVEDDVRKAEGGNKAAGTRARATMQEIKNSAQEVRAEILKARGGESEKPASAAGGG
jgi:hypothetical protein